MRGTAEGSAVLPGDCELYAHPLVDGHLCPCRVRRHEWRRSVASLAAYPPPVEMQLHLEARASSGTRRGARRAEPLPPVAHVPVPPRRKPTVYA